MDWLLRGHPPTRDLHPYGVAHLTGGGERTRAAGRALKDVRERHSHLDPRLAPAYGAGAASMGVALFGTGALMTIDPDFTQTVGLGKPSEMAGRDSSRADSGYSGPSCSSTASVCSSGGPGCGGGSSCSSGGGSSCGSSS